MDRRKLVKRLSTVFSTVSDRWVLSVAERFVEGVNSRCANQCSCRFDDGVVGPDIEERLSCNSELLNSFPAEGSHDCAAGRVFASCPIAIDMFSFRDRHLFLFLALCTGIYQDDNGSPANSIRRLWNGMVG